MAKKAINKIIYFDKETIRNILQERDHGDLSKVTDISSTAHVQASIATEASAKLKLEVPLVSRISFLFTGKIDASYVIKRDSTCNQHPQHGQVSCRHLPWSEVRSSFRQRRRMKRQTAFSRTERSFSYR